MRAIFLQLFVAMLLTVGCAGQENDERITSTNDLDKTLLTYTGTNVMMQIMSGHTFLSKEHLNNRVPGASKDTHGAFQEMSFDVLDSGSPPAGTVPFPELKFPFSWTFHFVPDGDIGFTNHYTVLRVTNDSPWHLVRAWRTGPSGQIVKEWPIDK